MNKEITLSFTTDQMIETLLKAGYTINPGYVLRSEHIGHGDYMDKKVKAQLVCNKKGKPLNSDSKVAKKTVEHIDYVDFFPILLHKSLLNGIILNESK